ncbi:Fe-S oxidoreductase [Roseimaritima sediminicola]|uniref:Fe-S oxidoreductase n=1 Tax=Roseimaritima sediminicola TaxID=2662066 RepID=UPI0012984E34|nr:Fe-S oxidoreductase [Roseimaritima sediminicola]
MLSDAGRAKNTLTGQVLAARGAKQPVTAERAGAVLVEEEADGRGGQTPTLTILLAAAECPLRCAMCDLWQQTLPGATPPGAIVTQIRQAIAQHWRPHADGPPQTGGPAQAGGGTIKLYNSGSFFDPRSIPVSDYGAIARAVRRFDRVVVENHPRFGRSRIERFASQLAGRLEIAVGLETVQPGMLRRLNKGMTRDDFDAFARYLRTRGIDLRVFLMLRPPWTEEAEAVRWTVLSVRHALAAGARHITIIPARSGNGWMEQRQAAGEFSPPQTGSLLEAVGRSQDEAARAGARCVVTADLWDLDPQQDPAAYRSLQQRNRRG